MDLTSLSTPALRTLQADVTHALARGIALETQQAREQIIAIAQRAGIPLKDLGKLGGAKKKSVAVRYRNPEDSSKTWTGRGIKPRWVQAMQNAGTLETARVQ